MYPELPGKSQFPRFGPIVKARFLIFGFDSTASRHGKIFQCQPFNTKIDTGHGEEKGENWEQAGGVQGGQREEKVRTRANPGLSAQGRGEKGVAVLWAGEHII